MFISENPDWNFDSIALSGQCFRWYGEPGSWKVVHKARVLAVDKVEAGWSLSCSDEEWREVWAEYFDADRDYQKIREMVSSDDPYMFEAARSEKGVRILKQDPFETIITFIISQRKNIPAIRKGVLDICRLYGRPFEYEGRIYYSFPTPRELARADEQALVEAKMGYRASYIADAAKFFAENEELLTDWEKLSDEELSVELMKLNGVGPKVSDCVKLFAYQRLHTFPKDVWILRALEEHYPNGFPMEKYRPYAGVMQQYIFEHYRDK